MYAGWLTRLTCPRAPPTVACLPPSRWDQPTFDGTERTVEAYCLDRTDLDLYDEQVAVDFTARIRPTVKFDSIDALLLAMAADVASCRRHLPSAP